MNIPFSGVLTRLSHHILHRMPFDLAQPPGGRWLVIGASLEHSLLGCGGTLSRRAEIADGASASGGLTLATPGANGGVGVGLGCEMIEGERVAAIADKLSRGTVDVVFAPFLGASQKDELVALDEFSTALEKAPKWRGEIWMYETIAPLWPNRGIDISETAERKREMLSQRVPEGELEAVLGLNRYRGLRPMLENVEAFLVLNARAFLRERRRWRRGRG